MRIDLRPTTCQVDAYTTGEVSATTAISITTSKIKHIFRSLSYKWKCYVKKNCGLVSKTISRSLIF